MQDARGNVYASTDGGYLAVYHPESGRVETAGVRLPGMSGRERINVLQAAVSHPGGDIYGGTRDGYLFCYSPETGRIRNLGKPLMDTEIRGLAVGLDGKIYGLGGRRGGVSRLFVYDAGEGSYRDLGMLEVSVIPYYEWKALLFDAIVTAPNGALFLGNSEHRSRLFIYNP